MTKKKQQQLNIQMITLDFWIINIYIQLLTGLITSAKAQGISDGTQHRILTEQLLKSSYTLQIMQMYTNIMNKIK